MKNTLIVFLLVFSSISLLSCGEANEFPVDNLDNSVASVLSRSKADCSKFTDALKLAGILNDYAAGGSYTVFAPTNDSFDALLGFYGAATAAEVDPIVLKDLLRYHIITTKIPSSALVHGQIIPTSYATHSIELDLQTDPEVVQILSEQSVSTVLRTDWNCSNGVIHVIEGAFIPF